MTAAHTPGPWRVWTAVDESDGETIAHVGTIPKRVGQTEQHVCKITGWGFDYNRDAEQQFNALLIAAAPDLLAACERLLFDMRESHQEEIDSDHHGDGPDGCSYCDDMAKAASAIRKAKDGAS